MPSPLYNLSRNTEAIIGMQLATPEDFQFIQNWCNGKGYAAYVNVDQTGLWSMNVTAPNGQSFPAQIGYWAVLKNGVELNLITADQGAALFTVGDPVA